jgi:hypothetical protein
MREKPDFRPILAFLGELGRTREWVAGAGGFEHRYGEFEIGCSSLVQEELQNPISLKFIILSKHSNFENRTESAESRAPERNGAFGEELAAIPD